ncbi:MAG: hypothetical protein GWP06_18600 [Actinobacteria bacterium]|nr:hypothetical protein [Actinomycetota bacterium]
MSTRQNVTLEQIHALLEKLAEYVMNQVPTRAEMDKRFEQIDKRFKQMDKRFEQIDKRFEQVDKRFGQIDKRFEQVDKRFEQIDKRFEQVDKQLHEIRQQIDLIRTGQAVFTKTFELHHKRLGILEDQHLGYRVSDKKDKYG